MPLHAVILAAGQGTRMRSDRPKVLHEIGGSPLLAHVLATTTTLNPARIHVVYGHGGEAVKAPFTENPPDWVLQAEQLGTGHALAQAMPAIDDEAVVLCLYGDVPLIRQQTLAELCALATDRLAMLTVILDHPSGYGRIIRDARGQVTAVVEERDADPDQRAVREVNTGIMAAPARDFRRWLAGLDTGNAQGEYYLTDVVAAAVAEGMEVAVRTVDDSDEVLGCNTRADLARLERILQRRIADALMNDGITLRDPERVDVRGRLQAGRDCQLDVNVVIEGDVTLGDRVTLGPGVVIRNSRIDDDVTVLAMSVLDGVHVGANCRVGPFARLRPGAELDRGVNVGNFVEIKASHIGADSRVNHLSYVGDSSVGSAVNIGAGTITCNYDGAAKHRTEIGDGAFIGSNCALVAPLSVGAGATVGAGSTLSRDAPAEALTVARAPQKTVRNWRRTPKKS